MAESFAEQLRILREQIDKIDMQIVQMLNERARSCVAIGSLKRQLGSPLSAPDREDDVLRRVTAANPGPLQTQGLVDVFRAIITASSALE